MTHERWTRRTRVPAPSVLCKLPRRDQRQILKLCTLQHSNARPSSRHWAPHSRNNVRIPPLQDKDHVPWLRLVRRLQPLRVLLLTEPLLRPAPLKGRVARRVVWRMTSPGDLSQWWAGRKIPRGLAGPQHKTFGVCAGQPVRYYGQDLHGSRMVGLVRD